MGIKTIKLTDAELKLIIESRVSFSCLKQETIYKKLTVKLKKALEKKPIQSKSRKAKGRNLQIWAVEKIAALLGEELGQDKDRNNIRSREMGQSGVDVWLHKSLVKKFPIAVECKNQEHIQLNAFIEQAESNTTKDMPYWLLILKNKQLKNPVAVMDWNLFEFLYRK